MKKILLSVIAVAATLSSFGQAFFTQTSYRGAFAPSPTAMWSNGWTQWDPQNAVYPAPTASVSGTITANTTWSAGTTVLLQGPVYVSNNAILTIQPGVVVRGAKAVAGSALIICKGSQIMAAGTASSPIVFTSDQNANSRGVGDWGGVILLGKATINYTTGVNNIEGLPVSPESQYGGGGTPNDNDNSGTLSYVRIEWGGYVYGTNQEINGLTMGGVGRGTTLDHIQVSFTNDDGFEWFGGTVNAKYLISYRNLDDDFDTDNGYSGNVQFGLIVRDPNIADNPAVSTSEGFESDNDAGGTTATPLTSGIFSNVTLVGPYRGANTNTIAAGYRRSARLRRNTNLKIYNSILMDTQRGIHIDGSAAENNATAGTPSGATAGIKFKNNTVAGTANGRTCETNTTVTAFTQSVITWFISNGNDSIPNSSPSFSTILIAPYSYTAGDYRPHASYTATPNFTDAPIAANTQTIGTSIKEVKKQIGYVLLFPNPSADQTSLYITTAQATAVNIHVFDVTGKIVSVVAKDLKLEEGTNEFNISTTELTSGVYFVSIESGAGREVVKLIINK
ncbi:MAG TPA: T9SS type A sorting domain-containing protein [Bacteroidia bacterium]|nr:T9SS type A sorting domain-containing protein [Bacteroidia bacterium]